MVIVGVRVTAGPKQFEFFVGPENKIAETYKQAYGWNIYDRKKAIAKNTELESDLRALFGS
jgi:hypothetical protein